LRIFYDVLMKGELSVLVARAQDDGSREIERARVVATVKTRMMLRVRHADSGGVERSA